MPEILLPALTELEDLFFKLRDDPAFWQEYLQLTQEFSGRPTPLTPLRRLSEQLGGAQIWLKREDLNHSGAHKMNNVLGQGLLVQRMGKKRVIAETGAGQHGLATAIMAARMGRIPVVLDGYACTAAAAVLHAADQRALDHCIVAHVSVEPGHRKLLGQLGKRALVDLGMRLGEGSGAMLAVLLLKAACACHNGMATFEEAGVSGPSGE